MRPNIFLCGMSECTDEENREIIFQYISVHQKNHYKFLTYILLNSLNSELFSIHEWYQYASLAEVQKI